MILAAQYARVHKIPYLGICLGMQMAIVEFADVFVTDDIFYFTGCFSESSRKAAFYVADSDAYFVEFLSFSD